MNLLIRSSLIVIWLALAVIAITIVTEAVHMVRHHGLPAPHVRGVGWAQRIGRWVAVGLISLLPVNSFASTATAVGDAGPAATAQRLGLATGGTSAVQLDVAGPIDSAAFGSDGCPRHAVDSSAAPVPDEQPDHDAWSTNGATAPIAPTVHVVERGESIYAIAAEYAAGDETRTIEIADDILDLNLGNVMDDGQRFTNPALIQPGWTLTLPSGVGTPRVARDRHRRPRRARRSTSPTTIRHPSGGSSRRRRATTTTRPTSSCAATPSPTSPTNTSAASRTGRRSGKRTAATTWATGGPSTTRT